MFNLALLIGVILMIAGCAHHREVGGGVASAAAGKGYTVDMKFECKE